MWQYDRSVRFFVWKLGHVGDAVDYTGVSFPLPLSKHVCTALCGFHFHCESENANGCCTSVWLCFFCFFYFFIIFFLFCFSFTIVCLVRFVGFIINEGFLFAVLRCFVFAASSGFIFLQCLFLFFSPSLSFSSVLRSCNFCASLALC